MGCRLFWRYLLRWCQCHVRRRMVSTHHRLSESWLRSGESPRVRSSLKGIEHEFPMVSERDLEGGSAEKRRPLIGVRFGATLVLGQSFAGDILGDEGVHERSLRTFVKVPRSKHTPSSGPNGVILWTSSDQSDLSWSSILSLPACPHWVTSV